MTLEQELDQFAQRGGGQMTIQPRQGQDLEAFKLTISSLRTYEDIKTRKPPAGDFTD